MSYSDGDYQLKLGELQRGLLTFLQSFESEQEDVGFESVRASQQRLENAVGDFFAITTKTFFSQIADAGLHDFHDALARAVSYFGDAYETFIHAGGETFNHAFLQSRFYFCKGLERLYQLRMELPLLETWWYTPAAYGDRQHLDPLFTETDPPVGLMHKVGSESHGQYSLYVPETYKADQARPLLLCLHGAYGSGDEFIWTWMRIAKSAGYILLAPKSMDMTWSVLYPPTDVDSIITAFEEVCAQYNVDRGRVFLSGLSDGATFSYLLAFSRPDLFAGVAPIAGELSQVADRMLRKKAAADVPFFVIHGVHDHIFDIRSVRSTCGLLDHLGYNLRFDELPDWGHAYPYRINEQRVWPWFESLPSKTVEPE
ncbi:MAG: hypothetical protein KBT88_14460 [Gammaproteobacteria bacterium]|nr:hypothetical protein [Gammaproteobacteria bacterium]MBQ0840986.1 hypothetical protein [Gammaproteobacteria bacterium]